MSFNNVPWALDGALTESELARRAQYAACGGAEGITNVGDLKVIPLSSPGNGVRVSVGGATVLNRYTTPLNQAYTIANPTIETIDSTRMPAVAGVSRSHLVVAVVGDPQYSATGHPYMLSTDPPAGQENTFQYVRSHVIPNVPAGTKTFAELGLSYPAIELARLDIGAGSTTYDTAQIIDLRNVARPRSKDFQWHIIAAENDVLNVTNLTYEVWPDASVQSVDIPEWATYAYVDGWINGFIDGNDTRTQARMRIGSVFNGIYAIATSYTSYDVSALGRKNVLMGSKVYIPAVLRGETVNWEISATTLDAISNSGLATDGKTNAMCRLRFVEEAD
jgi:hypothetical protein